MRRKSNDAATIFKDAMASVQVDHSGNDAAVSAAKVTLLDEKARTEKCNRIATYMKTDAFLYLNVTDRDKIVAKYHELIMGDLNII